jgi:hypothetical protein
MGKHNAHVTDEELAADEIAAEALALALREYAANSRILSRGAANAMEFTAACHYEESADAAERMAASFENAYAEIWHARRAVPARPEMESAR